MTKQRFRVDGIILLDKPQGISSNAALQSVKRLFSAEKAGHTGALDPLATGMLPVCFGEATKFGHYLLEANKCYQVTAKLGETTTTGDAEGELLLSRPIPDIKNALTETVLNQFRGDILQIPPMYSALKHQGTPLYKLARQGQSIERAARPVHIFKLTLCEIIEDTLTLEISCSKGTYIRTLVEDLGEALGCGAHVVALRRLWVGDYSSDKMLALEALQNCFETQGREALNRYLLPVDSSVAGYPALNVSIALERFLKQGQAVFIPQLPAGSLFRLYNEQGEFFGLAEQNASGKIQPVRLVCTQ